MNTLYQGENQECTTGFGYAKDGDASQIWCLEPNGLYTTGVCSAPTITTITSTTATTTTTLTSNTNTATESSTTAISKSCLPGWSMYKNSCYALFTTEKTWKEANSSCSAFNGGRAHLVSITSRGELDHVESLSIEDEDYLNWIGLFRPAGGVKNNPGDNWAWTDGSSYGWDGEKIWYYGWYDYAYSVSYEKKAYGALYIDVFDYFGTFYDMGEGASIGYLCEYEL